MALATDANISRLQQMFPSVDGDVIAIVLNDCGNNVEQCINHLLEMSGDNSSYSGPTESDLQENWPSVSQASTGWKKPVQSKRPPRKKSPVPQSRYSGGPRNTFSPPASQPPGGNPQIQESNDKMVEPSNSGTNERLQMDSQPPPGGGVARKPLLSGVLPPRGPVVPPPGNIPPCPPNHQTRPNWQYYPGGRPIYAQPLFGPVYGGGPDDHLQPRIVAQSGGMPLAPRGGVMFRPSGQFRPPPPPRGVIPIGPNPPPLVRGGGGGGRGGGMFLRTTGTTSVPPQLAAVGIPSGMTLYRPMVPSGTPVAPHTAPPLKTNKSSQPAPKTSLHPSLNSVQQQRVVKDVVAGTSDLPVSNSHSLDPERAWWPGKMNSETRAHTPPSPSPQDLPRDGGPGEDVGRLEEAGREWMSWMKGDSSVTEKRLVLLRGLPGSGKSTLAREIAGKNGVICSTDDFFYKDGRYVFDASKLGEYHDMNKEKAREAMLIENTPVVIDNTNASAWEMRPYAEMAHSLGYHVEIVEPTTPWRFTPSELVWRNSHGVPHDKIEKMLERYEHGVTVDTILTSQRPTRERERRRENGGRGGHVTSHMTNHMTPAHPHYARRYPPPQAHKHHENSKPNSSSSYPTFSSSASDTLKTLPSSMSLSSSTSHGPISSSHGSPDIGPPHPPPNINVPPLSSHPPPSITTTAPNAAHAPNVGSSNTASVYASPSAGPYASHNGGFTHPPPASYAAPLPFSPPKLGKPSITSSKKQINHSLNSPSSIRSSQCSSSHDRSADSSATTGRKSSSPFSPPPTSQTQTSKPSSAKFNPLHTHRAEQEDNGWRDSETKREKSLTLSSSTAAANSNSDSLANSLLSKHAKEEEEERAAKMSKIWGDGKLSDDTEAHLRQDRRSLWGEGVWGSGGGLSHTKTAAVNLSWARLGGGGGGGVVWSNLNREAESDPVEGRGLVGQPLPGEFGPIGTHTKHKSGTKTDDSGTTETKVSSNSTTVVGSLTLDTRDTRQTKNNWNSRNGAQSQEKGNDAGKGKPASLSARHRSSSSELWVSAEIENWSYEEADNIFQEGRKEENWGSAGTVVPTSPSLHNHKSQPQKSLNSSTYEQLAPVVDSTFEDPAIVNLVKQSASSSTSGGTHLPEPFLEIDLEPESQEPLFAPPSSETSPEQQTTRSPSSSSDRLSLLISPPSPRPTNLIHNTTTPTTTTDTHFNKVYPNGVTAPTEAYFNTGPLPDRESTAAVSMSSDNTTETVQCSTPTLIPADEEEEEEVVEGGVVMEAEDKRDYFPSAFETDRDPPSAPGFCLNASGEVPNNNDITIIASSYEASLPVNCVSTSPAADSDNSRARRNLWPTSSSSGERERESQGVAALDDSPLSSVQETSRQSSSHLLSSADHTDGDVVLEKETPGSESDLAFLVECFPDLSRPFLKKLLQQSEGNVEEAVSTALVSSVVSPTQPVIPSGGDVFNWSPLAVDSFFFGGAGVGGMDFWGIASGSSAASATSESEMEGGGGGGEVWASDDDECIDDEELARLMQEELDLEVSAEEPGCELGVRVGREMEGEEDDNLVLRLSRSLALQLQQMFGSVDKHLPVEGELRDEDLKVLLSERAARQIWQKWIDTLEAKKVEIQLNQDSAISRAQSVPEVLSSPNSKPPERSSTEPERLTDIMSEQSAQQTSTKELHKMVMGVCNKDMARRVKLRQLFSRFKNHDRDTIHYVLLKNNFNFISAAAELEREKAESVDGNATSHSSPASFAGTAAKKPARPSETLHQQSPSAKSPSKRRRRAANKRKRKKEVPAHGGGKDAPSYDDLRAEAALHAKLRSEAFQKAARARSLKQGDVAVYYAQIGHSHTEKMKEANSRAAALIFQLHNDLSSQYLDLHGLYVDEAIAALQERLQSTTPDQALLYVITGKGLHSKGEVRIKPAVINYLKSKNYRFEELQGRLKVKLT